MAWRANDLHAKDLVPVEYRLNRLRRFNRRDIGLTRVDCGPRGRAQNLGQAAHVIAVMVGEYDVIDGDSAVRPYA
jgi:hypothetical protein